ncbi:MAG: hypothetical protein MJZ20_03580 [Bacteroidaceae bacterium]|nr:hypothetical protein [Bacteroidaceae bacterium]
MDFTETETKVLTTSFIQLIKQMNEQAYENEAALAVEESGAKIANLQGYLAGVRNYKSVLVANGYELDIKYMDTTERSLFYYDSDKTCKLNLSELRDAISDIEEVTDTVSWEEFETSWQESVDAMKDGLFYRSEKGRDLHFCKGWYEAMNQINNYIERLHMQLEYLEKEKAESLPFSE